MRAGASAVAAGVMAELLCATNGAVTTVLAGIEATGFAAASTVGAGFAATEGAFFASTGAVVGGATTAAAFVFETGADATRLEVLAATAG